MIQNIFSRELGIGENLLIRKNSITGTGPDTGKRVSIVTGIHGDELEGQYVCAVLAGMLERESDCLSGTVDIYPALNPLGIDSMTRGIPTFDLDMNRIFPGSADGGIFETAAWEIVQDITGSDVCVDIHSSNTYLTEIPQVRINIDTAERLVPLASLLNMDLIWVHNAATVLESTLAYSLNSRGTDTLVVEMGVGLRITRGYCDQLISGLISLLHGLSMWTGPVPEVCRPAVARDREVAFLNAEVSGIFAAEAAHWTELKKGSLIGRVYDPADGRILQEVTAPETGRLFTLREYPVATEGALLGRILKGEHNA